MHKMLENVKQNQSPVLLPALIFIFNQFINFLLSQRLSRRSRPPLKNHPRRQDDHREKRRQNVGPEKPRGIQEKRRQSRPREEQLAG
jgi:hypothetical protein